MKIRFLTAILIASSFALISCSLFQRKPHYLIGNWKIDSLSITKDANAIGYLLLAMAKQDDSSKADLAFTKDSLIFFTRDSSGKIAYYLTKTNELILQDSSNEHFALHKLNDSLVAVESKDSSVLFLKKL